MSLGLPDGIGYSDVPEAVNVVSEGIASSVLAVTTVEAIPPGGQCQGMWSRGLGAIVGEAFAYLVILEPFLDP
jgi:hypothetical protein